MSTNNTWKRVDDTRANTVSAAWLADRLVKLGVRRDLDRAREELYSMPIGTGVTTGVSAYVRIA